MNVMLLTKNYAVMDNGEVLPVVHWIRKEEIDVDMMDAFACVIGPTKEGKYIPHKIDWENVEIKRVN